ncbi:Tlg2-vesicle protein [Tieghemiomyces parasiticus]|uniref:Golgi apparatus membrane protein TVP38 n=1 Tax=Tieghemiomyces parasiticus TaxID=78921 RepID=A0A9W8A928_9FUNG|nr:Tlg2-vesicle protein [Tieghemiomyces parasiticus]
MIPLKKVRQRSASTHRNGAMAAQYTPLPTAGQASSSTHASAYTSSARTSRDEPRSLRYKPGNPGSDSEDLDTTNIDMQADPLGSRTSFTLLEPEDVLPPVPTSPFIRWWMRALHRRPWLPFAILGILSVCFGGLFWAFHTPILHWLERVGLRIRETGLIGAVIMTFFIFLTAFPPMMGYSTSVTLSGFAYGFPLGFIPAFVGALTGAIACFVLCRKYGQHHVQWVFNWNPHITAAVKAIERKGFKLLLLIRISPYPFTIINALLSGTSITLRDYSVATAISLLKLISHVYIGANLTSFSNMVFERMAWWQVLLMLMGIVVGLGVMIYVYRLTQHAIDSMAEIPPDAEAIVTELPRGSSPLLAHATIVTGDFDRTVDTLPSRPHSVAGLALTTQSHVERRPSRPLTTTSPSPPPPASSSTRSNAAPTDRGPTKGLGRKSANSWAWEGSDEEPESPVNTKRDM